MLFPQHIIAKKRDGEVLSREEIGVALGTPEAGERAIDVQVTRLRRKVERNPDKPEVLKTVRNVIATLAVPSGLLLQLALPDDVQCRFGVGIGPTADIDSASGAIPEGPGWWAAREATTSPQQHNFDRTANRPRNRGRLAAPRR